MSNRITSTQAASANQPSSVRLDTTEAEKLMAHLLTESAIIELITRSQFPHVVVVATFASISCILRTK